MEGDNLNESDTIRLKVLELQQKELKSSVDTLSDDVRDLVHAWRTATGLLAFVQITAKLAGAIIVLYGLWEGVKAAIRSLGNG
jgi:hypothetical protein